MGASVRASIWWAVIWWAIVSGALIAASKFPPLCAGAELAPTTCQWPNRC